MATVQACSGGRCDAVPVNSGTVAVIYSLRMHAADAIEGLP